MSDSLEQLSAVRCFEGTQYQFKHKSDCLNCDMQFSVYQPDPNYDNGKVLLWLSGLTCTDQNFVTKAGAQRVASELGITIVCPDTSPRGEEVADDAAYDLGQGAGFYVDATQSPWDAHFKMYSYITQELMEIIQTHYAKGNKIAISGHSMGGHGALIFAIKNPQLFTSVSAFAPIANPSQCPWGEKALGAYLGSDQQQWLAYDATELLKSGSTKFDLPLLVDQGDKDNFLDSQKLTKPLEAVVPTDANIRYQQGHDHSYFFIATYIEDHLRFHAQYL
ncbi:S-formylglutathione hydrolase [Glaciecola sp. 1036]|uniref:S-formylglutathione hydrolase n=1 Tax=Alteromonadaceae TaxID=72275 RepID=UPI003CFCB6F6